MSASVIITEVDLNGKKYYLEEVIGSGSDSLPLRNFYIINAFGNKVYIKTNSRNIAQQVVDEFYGAGFYTVKSIKGAKGADSPNVRATETRRGQYVQREKAKILNS